MISAATQEKLSCAPMSYAAWQSTSSIRKAAASRALSELFLRYRAYAAKQKLVITAALTAEAGAPAISVKAQAAAAAATKRNL